MDKKIKLKPKRGEQKPGQKGQRKHHCIACRKVLENDKSLKKLEKNKNCTLVQFKRTKGKRLAEMKRLKNTFTHLFVIKCLVISESLFWSHLLPTRWRCDPEIICDPLAIQNANLLTTWKFLLSSFLIQDLESNRLRSAFCNELPSFANLGRLHSIKLLM